MSKFVVNLENKQESQMPTPKKEGVPEFGNYQKPKETSVLMKILRILGAVLLFILIVGAIGGYFYWRNLKTTPQYSLALLIDAARRDDQKAIDELVDTDAVIEDFVPQITDKAVELYGRGVAPATINKLAQVAAPFLPALKERARYELPTLIREKTQKFNDIPFWAIAVGAGQYLEITQEGENAVVKSNMSERPLDLTLKKNGDKWQVVAVRDEVLARRIAEKVGQELITVAQKDGIKKVGEKLGVSNLEDILKSSNKIFK